MKGSMWTSSSMSVADSLILSGMGLLTVMAALSMLAAVIILFHRIMEGTPKKEVTARAVSAQEPDVTQEACAVILSVLCEEMRAAPEEIRVTSIRKL